MAKALPTAIAIGAVLLVGGGILYTYTQHRAQDQADRRQRETDQKIADLQQQLNARALPPLTDFVEPAASQPATDAPSFLRIQRLTSQVIQEGAQRLATRRPIDADVAVRIYQEGIDRVDPQNPTFYVGLGHANLVLGKYQPALDALKKAHDLAPTWAEPFASEGWAYWNLKQFPQAKQAWEQAVTLDPKSIEAWSGLSWVYLALRQRDEALKGFNLLIFSGIADNDWVMGRNLAAGSNFDLKQIRVNFPTMPDPAAFSPPAATAP